MRVATYTRISTDEEHQPYSLEAQTERLKAYVKTQPDWELSRSFSDQMSGVGLERPGLTRALREAKASRFDLLLVYRVDRLARSVRGLAHILEELDNAGVGFRSATEPFDTTSPAGRMMVQMLGVFAEFERATIVDRVIAGMERKASRGGWCGGYRPYGYNYDAETGFLVPHDVEAAMVPVIFDLYANKRLGSRIVANWLNDRGYRTRQGRQWSHASVVTVLRNRVYVGEIFFRDSYHPAPHPKLIDGRLFEKAQRLLTERGEDRSKRASNSSDYLLSSLMFCDVCGKRYVGASATGRNRTYHYYLCFSRQRYGKKACASKRLSARELEEKVMESIIKTYEDSGLIEAGVQEARKRAEELRPQLKEELSAVEGEIKRVNDTVDRYLAAFEKGTMPEALCGKRLDELSDRSRELRLRKEELLEAAEQKRVEAPIPKEVRALRKKVLNVFKCGDSKAKKAILQSLIHEIRIGDMAYPTYRLLPETDTISGDGETVRKLDGSVPPTGFEPVLPP